MSRGEVWSRLLWKEYREGRFVVLLATLAPAVAFPYAAQYPMDSWQRGLIAFPAAAGVHLAIALWAAGRGQGKKHGSEFALSHLPVAPLKQWAVSLQLAGIITAALGAWFGFWVMRAQGWVEPRLIVDGAIDLSGTYLVCYFIAQILGPWAAILFGAFRVVAGTLIAPWSLSALYDADAIWLGARMAVGAVAASLLFTSLSLKRPLAFRQATSLILLVVIVFAPVVGRLDMGFLFPKVDRKGSSGGDYVSQDLAVSVRGYRLSKYADTRLLGKDAVRFKYVNRRENRVRQRDFEPQTVLLGGVGENRFYFAQQRSTRENVRILEWNTVDDSVTVKAVVPIKGNVLWSVSFDAVSPDGRYMLVALGSVSGEGKDLWLVDLGTARSTVVWPGELFFSFEQVAWTRDRAILVDSGTRAWSVDLKAGTVAQFRFPREGRR